MHFAFLVVFLYLYLKLALSTTPLSENVKLEGKRFLGNGFSSKSSLYPRYTVYCIPNYAPTKGQLGIARVCWLTTQLDYPTGLLIYPKMVYFSKETEMSPVMFSAFTPSSLPTNEEYTYVKVIGPTSKDNGSSNNNNNNNNNRGTEPRVLVELGTANYQRLWFAKLEANGERSYPSGIFPKIFEMKAGDVLALFPCQDFHSTEVYEFERLKSHRTALKMAASTRTTALIKGIYITIDELPVDNQNMIYVRGLRLSKFFRLQRWFNQLYNSLTPIEYFKVEKKSEIFHVLRFVPPQFESDGYLSININEGCISRNQRYGVELRPHQLTISEKLSSAWNIIKHTLDGHPPPFTLDIRLEESRLLISVQGEPFGLPVKIEIFPPQKPIMREGKEIYILESDHRLIIQRGDEAYEEHQFINSSMCNHIACVAESLYLRGIMVVKIQKQPLSTNVSFKELYHLDGLKKALKDRKGISENQHDALF